MIEVSALGPWATHTAPDDADTLLPVPRPRIVSITLYATMLLRCFTLVFRLYLGRVALDHHAPAALLPLAAEAFVLGALPIFIAWFALRARPGAHAALRVLYVLAMLDAVVWLVLTPPFGLLVAILMQAGHGADEAGANAVLGFTAGRVVWSVSKLILLTVMSIVMGRQARAWLHAHRAAESDR